MELKNKHITHCLICYPHRLFLIMAVRDKLHIDVFSTFCRFTCTFFVMRSLTHLPLDKMAAISQTFSNAFSFMEKLRILIKITMFILKGPINNNQHWFRYWLPPNMQQAIISTNTHPIHWHTNAAPGGDVINHKYMYNNMKYLRKW